MAEKPTERDSYPMLLMLVINSSLSRNFFENSILLGFIPQKESSQARHASKARESLCEERHSIFIVYFVPY